MAPRKIIIDTDPGIDDVLAILLALSASAEEIELLLISLTFGNIDVENCLRNAVSMLHVLEKEIAYRKEKGLKEGYGSLKAFKPVLAVGAKDPLENQLLIADYYHGVDGLGGVHATAPHFSTQLDAWRHLFSSHDSPSGALTGDTADAMTENLYKLTAHEHFIPSTLPAHKEILRVLRENPADTVTVVSIGPLTNLALAAMEDAETFLRAKEVVTMGGAIDVEGNVTPAAEFNVYADAVAAARVFALTGPTPTGCMPLSKTLRAYPEALSKRLNLTLFPLDITTRHLLSQDLFEEVVGPLREKGSPLAQWASVFLNATFDKEKTLHSGDLGADGKPKRMHLDLSLHDPLTIWYMITHDSDQWEAARDRDIRMEATGQWTRGMCIYDKRGRKPVDAAEKEILVDDIDRWLHPSHGNRITQMVNNSKQDEFARKMLERIFL